MRGTVRGRAGKSTAGPEEPPSPCARVSALRSAVRWRGDAPSPRTYPPCTASAHAVSCTASATISLIGNPRSIQNIAYGALRPAGHGATNTHAVRGDNSRGSNVRRYRSGPKVKRPPTPTSSRQRTLCYKHSLFGVSAARASASPFAMCTRAPACTRCTGPLRSSACGSSHELTGPPIGTIVSTGSEVEGRMPAEGSPRRCGV